MPHRQLRTSARALTTPRHSEVPRGIPPSGHAPSPTQNTPESTHDPLSFRGPPRNLDFRSCPIVNSNRRPRPLCHSEVPRGISPSDRVPSPTQNTHESTHCPLSSRRPPKSCPELAEGPVSNHKTPTTQPPSRSRSSPPLTPLPSNLSPSSYHPTHPRTPSPSASNPS